MRATPLARATDILARATENLHPAYFAMVMSTGIVSLAFEELGFRWIAHALFLVNLATFAVLLPMFLARIVFFSDALLADLRHPRRCWGFLTLVVAVNTLGGQFFVLLERVPVARILWILGLASWVGLIYGIYGYRIVQDVEAVEDVVDGATLLTVVSTQSVAVLGSRIADTFGVFAHLVELISLTHFAAGWVLYLVVITLVAYRLLFRSLEPENWTGPYWICMGAVAITTLAGSSILLHMEMGDLAPAILVVTYLAWAIGAWWIPIQLYLDVWKFLRQDVAEDRPRWIVLFPWLRLGFGRGRHHLYDPPSWGRVFPMGMFTACTLALTRASGFEVLSIIPELWGWFALLVWGLTLVGTLRAVGAGITGEGRPDRPGDSAPTGSGPRAAV